MTIGERRPSPDPLAGPSRRPRYRRLDRFPDLLDIRAVDPRRYPYLLESVSANGSELARYDILFAFPGAELRLDDWQTLMAESGIARRHGNDFLQTLDDWYRQLGPMSPLPDEIPFGGGWFLFLSYELAGQVEPTLRPRLALDEACPVALARRIPAAIIRDHRQRCCYLVSEDDAAGEDRLALLEADLNAAGDADHAVAVSVGAITEETEQPYLAAVARALAYIQDGDVFQVNLSRQWQCRIRTQATDVDTGVYRQLRRHNPAPFAALASLSDDYTLISSSPERLVRVRDGWVETRPIAGTRPRSADERADVALAEGLMAHPKECAEHVMLIDLERNDLGRVCQPGTVTVDELMGLESYRHVHHIVSNVRGRLRRACLPGEVIRAVFPGGTITGCPKVRCMEIIAELEACPRAAYTGSVGYLDRRGGMDLNILIRTLERRRETLRFRAGAGIVADSRPEKELQETRDKARGLWLALTGGRDER